MNKLSSSWARKALKSIEGSVDQHMQEHIAASKRVTARRDAELAEVGLPVFAQGRHIMKEAQPLIDAYETSLKKK